MVPTPREHCHHALHCRIWVTLQKRSTAGSLIQLWLRRLPNACHHNGHRAASATAAFHCACLLHCTHLPRAGSTATAPH